MAGELLAEMTLDPLAAICGFFCLFLFCFETDDVSSKIVFAGQTCRNGLHVVMEPSL